VTFKQRQSGQFQIQPVLPETSAGSSATIAISGFSANACITRHINSTGGEHWATSGIEILRARYLKNMPQAIAD